MPDDGAQDWTPLAELIRQGLYLLWMQHCDEAGNLTCDPDVKRMLDLERAGIYRTMGAWSPEGALIGYAAFFVTHHLHHMSVPHAMCDLLYVAPGHRGATGIRMIRRAEAALWRLGVERIVIAAKDHVRIGTKRDRGVGDLLERMGYKSFERCFEKRRTRVVSHG